MKRTYDIHSYLDMSTKPPTLGPSVGRITVEVTDHSTAAEEAGGRQARRIAVTDGKLAPDGYEASVALLWPIQPDDEA